MRVREEEKGRALVGVATAASVVALPFAWLFTTGFDIRSRVWWVWLRDYWVSAGHPPLAESVVLACVAAVPIMIAGMSPWALRSTTHGKAAWARWADIKGVAQKIGLEWRRSPASGVVIGRWHGRYLTVGKAFHVQLFGPSRIGKTAGLIVPSVLALTDRSVVVNDPSGDVAAATGNYRRSLGKVVELRWAEPSKDKFNPLSRDVLPADKSSRGDLVDRQVGALINEGDAFWRNSGQDALSAVALYLVFKREMEGCDTSWGEVLSWISTMRAAGVDIEGEDDPVRLALNEAADEATALKMPARVAEGLMRLAMNDAKTRNNILATVLSGLKVFASDYVRAATERSTFQLSELREGVSSIYLIVPPAAQEVYGAVSALFLECLYQYLTKGLPSSKERGVTLLLDELDFLPPVSLVGKGHSIVGKYDVQLVYGFQDRGQPEAKYGLPALKAMDTSTAIKVVLTVGELTTAEWLSKYIGDRTENRKQTSWQAGKMESSVSSSEEGRKLVSTQDAMSIPEGTQLVLIQGRPHRPIDAQAAYAFKYQPFKRRLKVIDRPRA